MTDTHTLSTKERILTAATKVFAAKGFDRASTREIAAMAEVNLAGLHYHFHSKENLYVNEIQLNGNSYEKNFIRHSTLQNGGELNFTMQSIPNKARGTEQDSYPYSMSNED